jgi:predicted Zn-dependent protease
MKSNRTAGLWAAAAVLAASACVKDKVTGESRFAPFAWTPQKEQAIGDEAAPNFEQQFGGPYPNASDQQYLGSVVKEMASHSVRKDDFTYKFEILDTSEPNAFALPGGYVYVTRGLLENLESEGEFVAVLGHELGHVEHQHSMLQQNKTIAAQVIVGGIGLAAGEVWKKDPDKANQVAAVAGYGAPLALLHFSREQESEADVRGLYFAHAMGYDPREMKKTFEYFKRLEAQSGSSTPSFLRDHPTNDKRLEDIDDEIKGKYSEVLAKSPDQFRAPPKASDRFVQIVASLKKKSPAYRKHDEALAVLAKKEDAASLAQAKALVDEAVKLEPAEPTFLCTRGEIEHALGKGDKGRGSFQQARAAEQKSPPGVGHEYWKPAFYLGLLDVEANQGATAVPSLQRASELFPDNPVCAYYLGRAHELTKNSGAAVKAYTRAAELAPADSELHKKAAERVAALQPAAAPR